MKTNIYFFTTILYNSPITDTDHCSNYTTFSLTLTQQVR